MLDPAILGALLAAIPGPIVYWRAFYPARHHSSRVENALGNCVLLLIYAFMIWYGGAMGAMMGEDRSPAICTEVWEKTGDIPLAALRNESGLNGDFFLGTGYLTGEEYLHFFVQNENGSFTRWQLRFSTNVAIFEEDRIDGNLIILTSKVNVERKGSRFYDRCPSGGDNYYEFHIPKGSLVRQFTLE